MSELAYQINRTIHYMDETVNEITARQCVQGEMSIVVDENAKLRLIVLAQAKKIELMEQQLRLKNQSLSSYGSVSIIA